LAVVVFEFLFLGPFGEFENWPILRAFAVFTMSTQARRSNAAVWAGKGANFAPLSSEQPPEKSRLAIGRRQKPRGQIVVTLAQLGKLAFVSFGAVAFGLFAGFRPLGTLAQFRDQIIAQGIAGGWWRRFGRGCRGGLGRSEHADQFGHHQKALAALVADLVAPDLAGSNLALDGALADAENLDGFGQCDKGLCHGVPVTG
jgi:hypothetical protein